MTESKKSPAEKDMVVFDPRRVNHFLLRKQHLIGRMKSGDIPQMVSDLCGLHATSATTPYLSLHARMKGFRREMLEEELYVRKTICKLRGVRGTVYIHPREMIPIVFTANKSLNEPNSKRYYEYMGVDIKEYDELSGSILETLAGRGMSAAEIKHELDSKKNVSAVINMMCDNGLLIRGVPRGGWKSNVHTYYLMREYLPDIELDGVDEAEAREEMIGRYLFSFGPATEGDIAWWTAYRKGEVRKILEGMGGEIIRVSIEGLDHVYLMLGAQEPALRATPIPRKPAVSLLPLLDPYLMGYRDRERYLSPERYPFIYDRSGNATNSIMVDGKIAGVWDYSEDVTPTLKLFLFEKAGKDAFAAVRSEAASLDEFLSDRDVEIFECRSMTPLAERTAGSFMTPLKDACIL